MRLRHLYAVPELLRAPPCKRSIAVGYPNLHDDTGCMDWRTGSTILMTAKAVWSQGSLIQYGNGAGSARVGSDPNAELGGSYLRLVDILGTADLLGFARAGRQA